MNYLRNDSQRFRKKAMSMMTNFGLLYCYRINFLNKTRNTQMYKKSIWLDSVLEKIPYLFFSGIRTFVSFLLYLCNQYVFFELCVQQVLPSFIIQNTSTQLNKIVANV